MPDFPCCLVLGVENDSVCVCVCARVFDSFNSGSRDQTTTAQHLLLRTMCCALPLSLRQYCCWWWWFKWSYIVSCVICAFGTRIHSQCRGAGVCADKISFIFRCCCYCRSDRNLLLECVSAVSVTVAAAAVIASASADAVVIAIHFHFLKRLCVLWIGI